MSNLIILSNVFNLAKCLKKLLFVFIYLLLSNDCVYICCVLPSVCHVLQMHCIKNLGRLWLAYTELQGDFYMIQFISRTTLG